MPSYIRGTIYANSGNTLQTHFGDLYSIMGHGTVHAMCREFAQVMNYLN